MAKKPELTTEQIIQLIDEFYIEKCNRNALKLKIPDISAYICQKGHNVQAYTLRRNQEARKYIEQLRLETAENRTKTVVVYKTMNLDDFFRTNRTKDAMYHALAERDMYYKEVADAASVIIQEGNALKKKNLELQQECEELRETLSQHQSKLNQTTSEHKKLQKDYDKLLKLVDTYVYPEVANELLAKEKLLKETAGIVDTKVVDKNLVTANTDVGKIKNNIVKGLFDTI